MANPLKNNAFFSSRNIVLTALFALPAIPILKYANPPQNQATPPAVTRPGTKQTPKTSPPTPTKPPQKKAKKTAKSILFDLFKGDDKFVHKHPAGYFKKFSNHQTPEITFLTCSDSRVHDNIFEFDPNNHIFTIRNIGNQMLTGMGSIDYGVLHLNTPLLIIMGHSHCGAIKAALSPYHNEPFAIIRELDHLFTPLKPLLSRYSKEHEHTWMLGVERNVDYQVALAVKRYQKKIKKKKLHVIGMIDDIANRFGQGFGRVVLVNINGETKLTKLRNHPLVRDYNKHMKQKHIRRLRAVLSKQTPPTRQPSPKPTHRH
jgi:carbonic anhydrase